MAELSPPGFDFMVRAVCRLAIVHALSDVRDWGTRCGVQFFGLFGLTNRVSSIVGPNVIQAIIDRTGNTWQGFPFLFAICLVSTLIIWLAVDLPKGRRDAEHWAAEQRGMSSVM